MLRVLTSIVSKNVVLLQYGLLLQQEASHHAVPGRGVVVKQDQDQIKPAGGELLVA